MKVIRFLAVAAIALTATTAMAQGGPPQGGQGGGNRQMEMMMQGITLTDAQKTKVDSIVAASRAESMKMRQDMQAAAGGPPDPAMMDKMRAITTKRNDAIKAVLTPDQQAIFAKNLENMPQGRGQRPPPR
jgi:Spy/CpxP family protein refolding chaperone